MKQFMKRIVLFMGSVLLLSILVFCLARWSPMDPLQAYYGQRVEKMSETEKAHARQSLGLDRSVAVQYVCWLQHAARGNFGISYRYKQDVLQLIRNRLPNTLILGGTGYLLIFLGALALGIFCAGKEDGRLDRWICRLGTVASCIPEFWIALLLILLFSVQLGILPGSGAYCPGQADSVGDRLNHLMLPLLVMVASHLWYYAYLVRNKMVEELKADYVLLEQAMGLSKGRILLRHCLPNIMPVYLSVMAVAVAHILGGTYVVEMVFSYPGLGELLYESARSGDYNVLQVLCLMTGILIILCSTLTGIREKRGRTEIA